MNMYDKAYELAAAVKASDEVQKLTAAGEKLRGNEEARKLAREFILAQMQADYARMAGKEPDEKTADRVRELAVMVSNSSDAAEYLQAFMRFQQLAADLQKIVGDAMSQGLDVLELDKK